MTYRTSTISYNSRARIFWFLIIIALGLALIQIVAVGATTRNIASRQILEKEVLEATARTGALEFTYIELKNQVNIGIAQERGYKESKNPVYVSRLAPDSLGTFTLNR